MIILKDFFLYLRNSESPLETDYGIEKDYCPDTGSHQNGYFEKILIVESQKHPSEKRICERIWQ